MPVHVRPYKQGKQGAGVWEVHIRGYFPDKTLYEEKARSELAKPYAQRWGLQRELEILGMGSTGWREQKEQKKNPLQTLAEYAPGWLDNRCKERQHAKATRLSRESVLRNHILPLLGEKLLGEITEFDLKRLKKVMGEGGAGASHINGALVTIRMILHAAEKDGQRKESAPDVTYLPMPETESLWYELPDYEQLVAKTHDVMGKLLILLGGDAGFRMGEMMALEWSHVHFARNQIDIKKALKLGEERPPKHRSYRSVEMTERLREALQGLLTKTGRVLRPIGLLTPRWGGTNITEKKMAYALSLAEKSAGLIPRGRLHMLRHTFGARLAMAGATIKEIAQLMGHKNLSTTEIYMHLSPSLKGRAIRLLENSGDGTETRKTESAKSLKQL